MVPSGSATPAGASVFFRSDGTKRIVASSALSLPSDPTGAAVPVPTEGHGPKCRGLPGRQQASAGRRPDSIFLDIFDYAAIGRGLGQRHASERISAMNAATIDLDQTEEEALKLFTSEASDEALEAVGGAQIGAAVLDPRYTIG